MTRNTPIHPSRIAGDIDGLAAITEPDRPWTRRAFTPTFLKGRDWLAARFEDAGLRTHIDAAGNLIGSRAGTGAKPGTIMLGSHSDTVPDGGRFDGIAGISAALEVARALKDQHVTLDHDLEIVDFLAEEVSIFGVSCIGSRGMIGLRPDDWLDREAHDFTLRQAIAEVGGRPAVAMHRDDIRAFLELHIEQGPVLETGELDIGVVTAIAGITRIEVIIEGRADHAGTTPMGSRRDALVAAAHLVVDIEHLGIELSKGDTHFAATVGEFSMEPNAANVVPSSVRLLIDARAEDRANMDRFLAHLQEGVDWLVAEKAVTIAPPRIISDNQPTPLDELVQRTLDQSCDAVGARHRRMASGAGHDAAWMARVTRSGMIFIPCLGGRSHAPEEFAKTEDIALGAAVLLEAVKRLDKELD
ncbi:MAG TPA: Zn-dependent hydrolase [Devosia sp.]